MLLKSPKLLQSNPVLNHKLSNALALIIAFQLAAVIIKASTPVSLFELMNLSIIQFHLLTFCLSIVLALLVTSSLSDNQQTEISTLSDKEH